MTGFYLVRDLNATVRPRTHEFLNSEGHPVPVTFSNAYTPARVEAEIAMTLVGIPGFVVTDEHGSAITSHAVDDGNDGTVILAANQTIATYDELSRDALLTRALTLGGKFTRTANKEELVAFLVAEASLGEPGGSTVLPDEEVELDESEETVI